MSQIIYQKDSKGQQMFCVDALGKVQKVGGKFCGLHCPLMMNRKDVASRSKSIVLCQGPVKVVTEDNVNALQTATGTTYLLKQD